MLHIILETKYIYHIHTYICIALNKKYKISDGSAIGIIYDISCSIVTTVPVTLNLLQYWSFVMTILWGNFIALLNLNYGQINLVIIAYNFGNSQYLVFANYFQGCGVTNNDNCFMRTCQGVL